MREDMSAGYRLIAGMVILIVVLILAGRLIPLGPDVVTVDGHTCAVVLDVCFP